MDRPEKLPGQLPARYAKYSFRDVAERIFQKAGRDNFMNKLVISPRNKAIFCGVMLSLMVNYIFYLNDTARPIGKLQYNICIYFPFLLFMPMALIAILGRSILRGKIPSEKWEIEQAKDALLKEDNFFKRLLARSYLILDKPICLIAGWATGSGLFYYLSETFTKK